MTKYCKEIITEICGHLQDGVGRVDTCYLVDISYETFTVWMKRPTFCGRIKKAEARCKARNIKIIQKAGLTTWQAAAWYLERHFPNEFALRVKNEMSGYIANAEGASEIKERQSSVRKRLLEILGDAANEVDGQQRVADKNLAALAIPAEIVPSDNVA